MSYDKKYKEIVEHYEDCLEKHGDSHLGVDWPKKEDAETRYRIMLELLYVNKEKNKSTLLDFGCGTAHLYEYILKNNRQNDIVYSGLDLSEKFIAVCKNKFPEREFIVNDILDETAPIGPYDYVVMNGVFTEKRDLGFEEMWAYFTKLVTKVYTLSDKGIAFNVMSKQVDWERDDLFHVPLDKMADFLCKQVSRNFVIRNDYGLYEYCVYLYKNNTNG